jgi:hypothetical protein
VSSSPATDGSSSEHATTDARATVARAKVAHLFTGRFGRAAVVAARLIGFPMQASVHRRREWRSVTAGSATGKDIP